MIHRKEEGELRREGEGIKSPSMSGWRNQKQKKDTASKKELVEGVGINRTFSKNEVVDEPTPRK